MTPNPYFMTSPRLGFRVWRPADLPLAKALWQDERVMQWLGGPYPDARIEIRFQQDLNLQATRRVQYWPIFLRDSGEHVGVAGLRPWNPEPLDPHHAGEPDVYEAGVHLHRRFWSSRLGEEAALRAVQFAFDDLRAQALIARHHPGNTASQQLILRLGFTREQDTFWSVTGLHHPTYRLRFGDRAARAGASPPPRTVT